MIVERRGLQFSISVQGSFTEKVIVEQKKLVHIGERTFQANGTATPNLEAV